MEVYNYKTRTEASQPAVGVMAYSVGTAHETIFPIRKLGGELTPLQMRDRAYFSLVWKKVLGFWFFFDLNKRQRLHHWTA